MKYTLIEDNGQNFIEVSCEDQGTSIVLSKNELNKALLLLKAVDNSVVPSHQQNNTMPDQEIQFDHIEEEQSPKSVRQVSQPAKAQPKSQQVDMAKVRAFLTRIDKEQRNYNQENDVENNKAVGFAETAITRAIKNMYPSVDKETMYIALSRSAIGMDRELFDITFARAFQKELEVFDDE